MKYEALIVRLLVALVVAAVIVWLLPVPFAGIIALLVFILILFGFV